MNASVSVFGLGYVGTVTAACLAHKSLSEVVAGSEVVVISTRGGVKANDLGALLRPDQVIIDLVNIERASRPAASGNYEGICW
jgi:UDP-N-acetyl-D-mannosaminuronate dehydrogenase